MQPGCSTWQGTVRGMAALAVLATCGLAGCAKPPASTNGPPQPLPKEIVEAWGKAGAEVGWMHVDESGILVYADVKQGMAGVPAFKLRPWKKGLLAKLPDPGTAFGLTLYQTWVTDEDLKELAGLKSLHTLNLIDTHVTGAGLKELAGLKGLHTLYLPRKVTDEDLKGLAGLKSLHTLNLSGTKVTDAGLKELAGLTSLQTLYLRGTKVTGAGLAELKKALPRCQQILD